MTTADQMPSLRRRTSTKWRSYPEDVLPMFIAEMDFPTPPPVKAALEAAIENNDTGYAATADRGAAQAYADFAAARWGWRPDPERIMYTTDVTVVIVEALRRLIRPGEGVVLPPPVYAPFYHLVAEAGGRPVEVPLRDDGAAYRLDLPGIDAALAAGARAVLLCNPHNPLGLVHDREELAELAEIVERHGAHVVSDEIHAPLTHRGATFTPYLSVSDAARRHGVAAASGSKAFNLAGLKAAMFVVDSEPMAQWLATVPDAVSYRTGIMGLLATQEGFRHATDWLDATIEVIESNIALLERQLADKLPQVRFRRGSATYLAWLDMRDLGWGDDPAEHAAEHAKVALSSGPTFGAGGAGFARMNLACSPDTIVEAVDRLSSAARG
ncbi:aminotransferase class I/II-fold pyridoxal phosphate-dependent enzyme [Kocuria rhizophila]|uniref:MalY/PatB family protein n=1 Tax=Kocuria rhizophila TaxID=72000 RepID=UPI000EF1E4F5|nr:aminotransferase class I/II-fold pyridoxal phosphate-dependent enzyme [Kocuria rhizophila]RLP60124.1 aminotransferase class I/II-fold pyridoxal phosphate-dependent enzyme [Kocuria rhizophila]